MGSSYERLKLHGALVVLQLGFAGFEILARNLLISGFSPFVFPVYRNAIAFLVLAPLAFVTERNVRPEIKLHHFPMFLTMGTIGIFCNQVCYVLGLRLTSAPFTSAYRNTMPVFTFILASLLGLEKVDMKRREGQAKVLGTFSAVVGALIMTTYRGPEIVKPVKLVNSSSDSTANLLLASFHISAWSLGVAILTAAFIAFAIFLTIQARLMKEYPAPLTLATISIAIGGLELGILAAVIERNTDRWALTSSSMIVAVMYAGLVASGLVSAIQSWGIKKGGPIIVASYQPLETVAVAVLSLFILNESFHLGSLVGTILVIAGLYCLIWGQAKAEIAQPLLADVKV